jgi:YhcH/YjgK/YiaL family protein
VVLCVLRAFVARPAYRSYSVPKKISSKGHNTFISNADSIFLRSQTAQLFPTHLAEQPKSHYIDQKFSVMILDSIINHHLYFNLHPLFGKAFDFLTKTDFNKLELGKHILEGDDLFVILMEYETKESAECIMESHRKYIDIQYMVQGEELMGVALQNGHMPSVPYDETKEAAFYEASSDSLIKVAKGQFAIFFPHDLHRPCIKHEKISKIRKAVFKVRVAK